MVRRGEWDASVRVRACVPPTADEGGGRFIRPAVGPSWYKVRSWLFFSSFWKKHRKVIDASFLLLFRRVPALHRRELILPEDGASFLIRGRHPGALQLLWDLSDSSLAGLVDISVGSRSPATPGE